MVLGRFADIEVELLKLLGLPWLESELEFVQSCEEEGGIRGFIVTYLAVAGAGGGSVKVNGHGHCTLGALLLVGFHCSMECVVACVGVSCLLMGWRGRLLLTTNFKKAIVGKAS